MTTTDVVTYDGSVVPGAQGFETGWHRFGIIDPDDTGATVIVIRCYLHEDGTLMIPADCQSGPDGEFGWVEATTGQDAILIGGVPCLTPR